MRVVSVDRDHTADRRIAPRRTRDLFSQLLIAETRHKRERLRANLLTKRDDFAEARLLVPVHPLFIHLVNKRHHLFPRARLSISIDADSNRVGIAFNVTLDDPIESHLDADKMREVIPGAPQRFGVVAALSDPASEVLVWHRRELFQQPRPVSIQFYFDLCAIHMVSTFW